MLLPKKWKAASPAMTANTVVLPETTNQNGSVSSSEGVTGFEVDAKS
jgi:hypothetical protein